MNEKSYFHLRESLEQLGATYPHAIEIDEELCLFLVESGDDVLADQVLQQIESRYSIRPEETLCRFGRRYKERSLEFLDSSNQGLSTEAEKHLRRALEYYQEAYRLHGSYYPGINVASLMYLLKVNDYREVANEVRRRLPADFTKSVWGLATLGEIHFLLDEHGKAQELYREAVSRPECQPQNRVSMHRQLELLLRFSAQKDRDAWKPHLDIIMDNSE